MDTLTGKEGAEGVLSGAGCGVFHADRSNSKLGDADYALITDFSSGVNKLQVRAGTSDVDTTSTTGLSPCWDRKKDSLLTNSGKGMDALIAVMQGLTAPRRADLIGSAPQRPGPRPVDCREGNITVHDSIRSPVQRPGHL